MPVGDTRKLPRGTSYRINVEFKIDGAPASLVGATLRFTIKPARYDDDTDDSSATLIKNVSSHDNAAGGLSHITINPADTDDFVPGDYFYDVKVQLADLTKIYTLEEGMLLITGSPTNRFTP